MRSGSRSPSSSARRPASDPPSSPVTPTRSPGRAPSRPASSSSPSAQPVTATVTASAGPLTTSPPAIVVSQRAASSSIVSTSSSAPSNPAGRISDAYASPGSAPIAATSDSAVASAFHPTSPAEWVASEKCTPSTTVSIEVTASGRARTTAASSPVQRTVRPPRSVSAAWIARIRSSSATSPPALLGARVGALLALRRALIARHLDVGRVLRRLLVVARVELLVGAGAAALVGRGPVVLGRVRDDRLAGARVLAEERVELGGRLGLREVVAVLAVGRQHERVPDRRRVGAALRARHGDAGVGIADPDPGRQVRGVADEPGVL